MIRVVGTLEELLYGWTIWYDLRRWRRQRLSAVELLELVMMQSVINFLNDYLPERGLHFEESEEEEDW